MEMFNSCESKAGDNSWNTVCANVDYYYFISSKPTNTYTYLVLTYVPLNLIKFYCESLTHKSTGSKENLK